MLVAKDVGQSPMSLRRRSNGAMVGLVRSEDPTGHYAVEPIDDDRPFPTNE